MSDEYLKLLKQKNETLKEIYDYTKSKEFKVSEEQVERVVYYLNNREKMFNKLTDIQQKIETLHIGLEKSTDEHKSLISKNDDIIKKILELDKEKEKVINNLYKFLKENIKSIKSTNKVNSGYLGVYSDVEPSNFFDSSR